MPTSVIEHIRTVVADGVGLRDGELLGRYVDRRDEAALAALVHRHAPMVWGVCRRQLSHHDAEDAFQATFIVLVRKAASIAQREAVGNWLYGVAHQAALQARRSAARRRAREVQVTEMPDAEASQEQRADLQPFLDEELSRLPDHYRTVIVLSDLEGRTRKEVAAQLGCPEGTVASRLVRARSMLAKRLTQRGVALSGGALGVVLSQSTGSAGVPATVVSSTIKAASLCAAGQAAGFVSAKVATLTEGVLKTMLLNKLKPALAGLLVVAMAGVMGFGIATGQQKGDVPQKDEKPRVEAAVKKRAEQKETTAWGKEVDGVQVGIQFGEDRTYKVGETVTLTVRLRNNGKKDVPFVYNSEYFQKNPPFVTDADGKAVKVKERNIFGIIKKGSVAPGKEVDLCRLTLDLRPETDRKKDESWTLYGTGKYHIQYKDVPVVGEPRFEGPATAYATGTLELEVKEPVKPAEAFTAWGKEFSGLQAGLGFRPGEQRAYTHGETVTLVVRVRNVGKENVKFQYLKEFFMEKPPTVTGGEGKTIRFGGVDLFGRLVHIPVDVNLAPGKEMELAGLKLKLEPASDGGDVTEVSTEALHGKGKFQIQYEKLAAASIDASLTKLATGKLELQVKEAEKQKTEGFTAWGKEVGGIQTGLGFRPGEKRAYTHGETVTLVARVRNVSKKEVRVTYITAYFLDWPPSVTDGEGKTGPQIRFPGKGGDYNTVHVNLAPGKEFELAEVKLELRPASESGNNKVNTLYGTGKFQIQYERLMYRSGAAMVASVLRDLATGTLELEIKSAEKK